MSKIPYFLCDNIHFSLNSFENSAFRIMRFFYIHCAGAPARIIHTHDVFYLLLKKYYHIFLGSSIDIYIVTRYNSYIESRYIVI